MLVSMLGSKEGVVQPWLSLMAAKHSFFQRFVRPVNSVFARRVGAVVAFSRLGSQGAPALPEIIPLLRDPELALPAMCAVMYINPDKEEFSSKLF